MTDEEVKSELNMEQAKMHIATLTYNRSLRDDLTDFQKDVIDKAAVMLAQFEYDNADLINNVLSSYSLNGASVSFGGANVTTVCGVCIRKDIYQFLCTSGLCVGVLI